MLPSTSTEERTCNVMKATFLQQYYDKEEARARDPPPRVKRGKFVFREFESKDGRRRYDIGPRDPAAQAKIEADRRALYTAAFGASGASAPESAAPTPRTSRSDVTASSSSNTGAGATPRSALPLATSSAVYGEFYPGELSGGRGGTTADVLNGLQPPETLPRSVYEQSVAELEAKQQRLKANLSAVSGALDAQKAAGRLSSRRRELKQQLHRVGSEVALVRHANKERRRAAQQARSDARKIASMEPWQQTSLEIEDKDCLDTLALSQRPKPRFSVEFDAPHNRSAGWSVFETRPVKR